MISGVLFAIGIIALLIMLGLVGYSVYRMSTIKVEFEESYDMTREQRKAAKLVAEAEAQVAITKANADKEVAQIAADSAEHQGKKEAAIKLQALASVNGWTVQTVTTTASDGTETTYNKLYKPDGTIVTDSELQAGVQNLLKSEYYSKWNGELPKYYMNSDGTVSTVLIPSDEE